MSSAAAAASAGQGLSKGEFVSRALLVLAPVTVGLHYARPGWSAAIFVCGCVAVIPLAGYMGRATEVLAARAGSGLGGLLNATFGNAAELILGIAALRAGHPELVKASITGSIVGNLLLILGASMFAGGLRFKEQRFSARAAESGASLMLLAVVGLFVPALLHLTRPDLPAATSYRMSVAIALVLLAMYVASLLFQLRTHRDVYAMDGEQAGEGAAEEAPELSLRQALGMLVAATVAVAVLSEHLVQALEGATASFGFTTTFVGVVILAIVGNAAEHSTAILMALKDRMNLSVSVALESSKQIALFVAPFLVLLSGLIGQPMSLEFAPLEVAAVGVSVMAATLISLDGRSNWLEGAMLLGVYAILGVAFFFTP